MGRQIIKQPNGLYALWSSVVDDFVMIDCTMQDIIDDFLEDYRRSTENNVRKIIGQLERGEKPYFQFTLTFDEAVDEIKERHGKTTQSLQMLREAGLIN